MEQIVIRIKDKEKAKMLQEMLAALDFVESISGPDEVKVNGDNDLGANDIPNKDHDFLSLAGLWENKDISLEQIRQNR